MDNYLGEIGRVDEDIKMLEASGFHCHPSFFLSRMPNECREV